MQCSIGSGTRRAIMAALVLILGLGGSAGAADVYNACSKDTTSKVRPGSMMANTSPVCRTGETARTWNQTGPQGIPGFSSCAPEEFDGTAAANTFAVLNASCSGTGKAVGGAAIWHTPFDAADNGPFYLFPRSGVMWTIIPWNHTGSSQDFRFFLQCCQ